MIGKKTIGALLVVLLAYAYNVYTNTKIESPVVTTKLGKLQGFTSVSRNGRLYYEYLGIPYSQMPIGHLRFEPPQPAKKWNGIYEATNYGAECAQLRLITGVYGGEEACLYLNIFAPKDRKKLLPVLVFLHGGAFVTGSSNGYKAKYMMDEDVILVTVNYRLAALGFLNTGDGIVRGNMGLKDQQMSLQWIKENIEAFGGNPAEVTLFGESAGSSSTSFHLASPMSKGLFHRAIMQSGACTSNWSLYKEPAKQAKRYANKFGCDQADTKEMVKCLKKIDVQTFVMGHEEILVPLRDQITIFVPTIEAIKDENAFLTEEPIKIFESGRANKVPVIAGVNSDEGLLTSAIITSNHSKLEQANNEYHFWAARLLNYPQEKTDVSDKIRKYYFGDIKNIASADLIRNYTNLFSDRQFFLPIHTFAKAYSKEAPVYLYFFTYQGQFSLSRILSASQRPYLPVIVNVILDVAYRWLKTSVFGMEIKSPGVCHADELAYFYNWQLSAEIKKDNKEYPMSRQLVKLWANFAKNESPLKLQNVEWKPVNPKESTLHYLKIDSNPQMIPEPFQQRIQFWEKLGV